MAAYCLWPANLHAAQLSSAGDHLSRYVRPKSIECLRKYNQSTLTKDHGGRGDRRRRRAAVAMAFAIASGVSPDRGIYTAIVAGFLISLLGGSRVRLAARPARLLFSSPASSHNTGMTDWSSARSWPRAADDHGTCPVWRDDQVHTAAVVTGFTSGIAVVIFSTQIKDLFGLKMETVPASFSRNGPPIFTPSAR
jgi:SulP family sulfate permease